MSGLPSREWLEAAIGTAFRLESGSTAIDVDLMAVRPGIPMNAQYTCYSVLLKLPPGIGATQGNYRLCHKDGAAWELLMTPLRPTEDGRSLLQAVFHHELARQTSPM